MSYDVETKIQHITMLIQYCCACWEVSLLWSGRMNGPINGYVGWVSVLVSAISFTCKNCYQHSYDSYFSSKLYPLFFNIANFSVAAAPLNVHVYEVYGVRCTTEAAAYFLWSLFAWSNIPSFSRHSVVGKKNPLWKDSDKFMFIIVLQVEYIFDQGLFWWLNHCNTLSIFDTAAILSV